MCLSYNACVCECIIVQVELCTSCPICQSGDTVVKREAAFRNRRDVIPLTLTTVKLYRRDLTPLMPMLKSLGGDTLIPDVSHREYIIGSVVHV